MQQEKNLKNSQELNLIDDILNSIKKVPSWVYAYNFNHHSPSQFNKPDDRWSFEYLFLTQKQRREFETNSKMMAGVAIGNVAQNVFADHIYDAQNKNSIQESKNDKLYIKKHLQSEFVKYSTDYKPTNEKDAQQFDWNKKGFAQTFENLVKAFKEVNLKGEISCERTVHTFLKGCELPTIGRIDFESKDSFIELKTKWRRRTGKPRDDGSYAHSIYKISETATQEHLLQCWFYHIATGKRMNLVIVQEDGYKIFNEDNCEQMRPNYKEIFEDKMRLIAIRRERLMARHDGKHTWTQDISLNMEHPFYWSIAEEYRAAAKELWLKNL